MVNASVSVVGLGTTVQSKYVLTDVPGMELVTCQLIFVNVTLVGQDLTAASQLVSMIVIT
jgi:hypothetical protein